MLLSTILFVVLLAHASFGKPPAAYKTPAESTRIEQKDGTFSREILLLKSHLSAAGAAVSRRHRKMADLGMRLTKRYFGKDIPWNKVKSFSLRNSKACSRCPTAEQFSKTFAEVNIKWLNKTIREETMKNRKFKPITFFRDNVGRVSKFWDNQILVMSTLLAPLCDQANYFVNKMVRDIAGFEQKSVRDLSQKITGNDVGKRQSRIYNLTIANLVPYLTRSAQKSMRKENLVVKLRNSLEMFYDKADKSNNTMVRALVKGLPKNDFTELVRRLANSLERLTNSPHVAPGIMLVVKATVDTFRSIDFNRLWALGYSSFLRVRLALLNVDVERIFMELHRMVYTIQKGYWRLLNGQWPALQRYFNMLAQTVASDAFWDRAQRHYNRTVHQLHEVYERRTEELEAFVVNRVRPFAVEAIEYIELLSNQVDVRFKRIADEVRELDVGGALESAFKKLIDETTKRYLACYTKKNGIPNLMMSAMQDESHMKDVLMDLFFRDWSKKQINPKGADAFFRKLANAFNLIITAILGECS